MLVLLQIRVDMHGTETRRADVPLLSDLLVRDMRDSVSFQVKGNQREPLQALRFLVTPMRKKLMFSRFPVLEVPQRQLTGPGS